MLRSVPLLTLYFDYDRREAVPVVTATEGHGELWKALFGDIPPTLRSWQPGLELVGRRTRGRQLALHFKPVSHSLPSNGSWF